MTDDEGGRTVGSVLILEDEALVSLLMEDAVRDLGAKDVHVFSNVEAARDIAEHGDVDCAILDIRMQNGTSREIADILSRRGVPFLFSTGSGLESIPAEYHDRPLVSKPFADDDLRAGVLAALASAENADG